MVAKDAYMRYWLGGLGHAPLEISEVRSSEIGSDAI